jgi:glutamate racemase
MLRPLLEHMVPPEVEIIDSGAAVATQTRKVFIENKIKRLQEGAQHQFFTNGNIEILSKIVKQVGYNAPPTVLPV